MTAELGRRPARTPDFQAENRALRKLARILASDSERLLEAVADTALRLCGAGSAGISLLEQAPEGDENFRWVALAGAYRSYVGGTTPADFSPCGICIERQSPQLFSTPSRFFSYLEGTDPAIVEGLYVPLSDGREIWGSIWIAAHEVGLAFDQEDARLLTSLADFAAGALQHRATTSENVQLQARIKAEAQDRERAENGFRQINQTLRTLIYSSPLPIVAVDVDPPLVRLWNPEAERLFGWREREVLGRPIPNVPEEKLADSTAYRYATALGKTFHDIETCRLRKDGTRVEVNILAAPLHDADSRVDGILLLYTDETERKMSAEALRDSELRYQLIVQAANDAIWDWDLVTNQVMWNEGLQRRFGYAAEEVGPKVEWWSQHLHPDDRQRVLEGIRAVIDSGAERWQDEYRFQRADGSYADVFDRGHLVHNDHTKAFRMVGFMMDLTERKRAEQLVRNSERIYRAVGESIDYGVWMCDAEGRNIYASECFLKLVGLTQQECSEFGWSSVLHPDDAERTLESWKECVRTGGKWDIEHRFRGVDGNWYPILARGVPVQNEAGEVVSWVGINLDIRRLKQVEHELQAADRRKDEFLATLAHELRNPLAPIRNAAHTLQMIGSPDPELQWAYQIIERQIGQMTRLIDDLLDVSRISRDKLELRKERVTLSEVIQAAVETSRPLILEAQHELILTLPSEPIYLDADLTRLAQVFLNLLNNSAKYTEKGGQITVTAECREGEVAVSVRDNGIGIAAEMLPNIFEMFTQVEKSLNRSQGGLGIGLTLVKRLVEMHGGRISAHSQGTMQGSEFVVCLPITAPPEESTVKTIDEGSSVMPSATLKILVVDDNRDSALSMGMMLQILNHTTRLAYDGEAAVAAVEAFQPDLILLDIGLPKLNGYAACRQIRELPGGRDITIIALTGWGQSEDKRLSAEAGFDSHLVKPIEPAVLLRIIQDVTLREQPDPAKIG